MLSYLALQKKKIWSKYFLQCLLHVSTLSEWITKENILNSFNTYIYVFFVLLVLCWLCVDYSLIDRNYEHELLGLERDVLGPPSRYIVTNYHGNLNINIHLYIIILNWLFLLCSDLILSDDNLHTFTHFLRTFD